MSYFRSGVIDGEQASTLREMGAADRRRALFVTLLIDMEEEGGEEEGWEEEGGEEEGGGEEGGGKRMQRGSVLVRRVRPTWCVM